ncbi:hypothetical protein HDV05_006244 [Chytridiales sp. JEL 0842]|nr:hypothetical protein HDV05_006244 [Chytridiales sp. JEL 0842]
MHLQTILSFLSLSLFPVPSIVVGSPVHPRPDGVRLQYKRQDADPIIEPIVEPLPPAPVDPSVIIDPTTSPSPTVDPVAIPLAALGDPCGPLLTSPTSTPLDQDPVCGSGLVCYIPPTIRTQRLDPVELPGSGIERRQDEPPFVDGESYMDPIYGTADLLEIDGFPTDSISVPEETLPVEPDGGIGSPAQEAPPLTTPLVAPTTTPEPEVRPEFEGEIVLGLPTSTTLLVPTPTENDGLLEIEFPQTVMPNELQTPVSSEVPEIVTRIGKCVPLVTVPGGPCGEDGMGGVCSSGLVCVQDEEGKGTCQAI